MVFLNNYFFIEILYSNPTKQNSIKAPVNLCETQRPLNQKNAALAIKNP